MKPQNQESNPTIQPQSPPQNIPDINPVVSKPKIPIKNLSLNYKWIIYFFLLIITLSFIVWLFLGSCITERLSNKDPNEWGSYTNQPGCFQSRSPIMKFYRSKILREGLGTGVIPNLTSNKYLGDKLYCEQDSDCTTTCGGKRGTSINKFYFQQITPAFYCLTRQCNKTGIESKCINNKCTDIEYECECC